MSWVLLKRFPSFITVLNKGLGARLRTVGMASRRVWCQSTRGVLTAHAFILPSYETDRSTM
jgi:hypothetical protein